VSAPVRITVTGAAGQIGYALVFRLCAGAMLGRGQRLILQLLEIPQGMKALQGVAMELQDCAFPRLHDVVLTDDPEVAFRDTEYAFLIGSRPRTAGMERKDLLQANAEIFRVQGKALNEHAARTVRVVVVGNPANTNALIARSHAPDLPASAFTAMTRLDYNRARAQLAAKLGCGVAAIQHLCLWGNHSSTQVPDVEHVLVDGQPVQTQLSSAWVEQEFIPKVAGRGAEIINVRGASSAASAANAALEHLRDWTMGTAADEWVSMAVSSGGAYDVPDDLVYSFPVSCGDGHYHVVADLDVSAAGRQRMQASRRELEEERDAIAPLLGPR